MPSIAKLARVPTLAEVLSDPAKAVTLPREAIPQLRGELARLDTILLSRLLVDDSDQQRSGLGDRLLDVSEAAEKLGLSHDALYRNDYPFVVKIGNRRRFSEKGIEKFIRSRAGM